jgi:hypothetical protein
VSRLALHVEHKRCVGMSEMGMETEEKVTPTF